VVKVMGRVLPERDAALTQPVDGAIRSAARLDADIFEAALRRRSQRRLLRPPAGEGTPYERRGRSPNLARRGGWRGCWSRSAPGAGHRGLAPQGLDLDFNRATLQIDGRGRVPFEQNVALSCASSAPDPSVFVLPFDLAGRHTVPSL